MKKWKGGRRKGMERGGMVSAKGTLDILKMERKVEKKKTFFSHGMSWFQKNTENLSPIFKIKFVFPF